MVTLLPFLLRNWKLAAIGVVLAIALIWGAAGHMSARHWEKRFVNEQKARAELDAALVIKNDESLRRAEQYAQAEAADARNRVEADRRWRSTEARIAALRAIRGGVGGCPVPEALSDALGGL